MKTSEQIDKLAEALSKAQGSFQNPEKNKTATIPMKAGGKYSYDYADLPESLNVTRKALSENGLSHLCTVSYIGDEGIPMLLGRLLHSSGQWVESEFLLPNSPDPKLIAASMTYGRRYLFNALTGIAADDDIDAGEDNVEYKPKPKKIITASDPQPIANPWVMNEKRMGYISELCKLAGFGQKSFLNWCNGAFATIDFKSIEDIKSLNEAEYSTVILNLKSLVDRKAEKEKSEPPMESKSTDPEAFDNFPGGPMDPKVVK